MSKIVLVSDSHGSKEQLQKVLMMENNADYYLHCGDSACHEEKEISPFRSVRGNVDRLLGLPQNLFLDIEGHKIMVTHGHYYFVNENLYTLYDVASQNGCDLVFYGHTHCIDDTSFGGIRFINPGSLSMNRDGNPPSYAVITIENEDVKLERYFL